MASRFAPSLAPVAIALLLAACEQPTTGVDQPSSQGPEAPRAAAAAQRGTTVSHFVADGEFAALNAATTSGGYVVAYVTRYGKPSAQTTYLFYSMYDPANGGTYQNGSGLIPNGDFSGRTDDQAKLHIVVAPGPNFIIDSGSGGLIDLTWRATRDFTSRFQGSSTYSVGTFTQRNVGSSEYSSAAVAGTVLGLAIDPTTTWFNEGELGRNHNVTIDFLRN